MKSHMKINWYQGSVLADRYLETILADWKNTLLLLIQAPILAGMAVLVWGNIDSANQSLFFVMTLSAIWLGCMDACREIVKERALFLRERMVNLEVGAYLYSKIRVLALLNIIQIVTYSAIVTKFLDVRVPIGWLFLSLLASALCGTCLGLLISSAVKRSDYAVGFVPLVILPQILFSEFAINKNKFSGLSEIIYILMPSKWGFESLSEFAKTDPKQLEAFAHNVPPLVMGACFIMLAYPILRAQRY